MSFHAELRQCASCEATCRSWVYSVGYPLKVLGNQPQTSLNKPGSTQHELAHPSDSRELLEERRPLRRGAARVYRRRARTSR